MTGADLETVPVLQRAFMPCELIDAVATIVQRLPAVATAEGKRGTPPDHQGLRVCGACLSHSRYFQRRRVALTSRARFPPMGDILLWAAVGILFVAGALPLLAI